MRQLAILLAITLFATPTAMAEEIGGMGLIASRHQRTVQARLPGVLQDVQVSAGDFVKRGQVLGVLQSPDLQLKLHHARAQREQALSESRIAELELRLLTQQATAQGHDEELTVRVEIAKARVQHTQNHVKATTTELGILQQFMEQLQLRSPLDGQVTSVHVTTGDVITKAGTPLFTVSDPEEFVAKIHFPTTALKSLLEARDEDAAMNVTLHTDVSDFTISGKLLDIAPTVDAPSQTILTTILFDRRPFPSLRPGMKVNAKLKK